MRHVPVFVRSFLPVMLLPALALAHPSAMVTDISTGAVLMADDADARRFPASLAKLMTLYLLFGALDDGSVALDQKLPVSPRAATQPPTRLGLRPGSHISVEECIDALIVRSANDVATVVAEALGTTESAFAEKMTVTARELGMNQTVFRNASGLPDADQFTTARDLTILAQALITRFPGYYHYFATPRCRVAGKVLTTHNFFLRMYDGADGLKTGYTQAAGYNLAASVERHGHRLVGVVLGGATRPARDLEMAQIMDQAFSQLGYPRAVENRRVVAKSGERRRGASAGLHRVHARIHHHHRRHLNRAA